MKIAVLGTGTVGNTLGSRLIELKHEVRMGSRTTNNEKAAAFVAKNGTKASAGTFADSAAFGEVIFNCVQGVSVFEALAMAGAKNLDGKVLVDVSNPLDFSKGMPPSLSVCNTNSLGEEIQRAYPKARVVKALNTMWCGLMVNPKLIGKGDHHTFICGDNADAKAVVSKLLKSFGWKKNNILDLGDISAARGTEMYLPLWLRIYGAKKSGTFNIRIVD